MAVDNTHTKYLRGDDKKAWQKYKEAYESMKKLENFVDSLKAPKNLKAGEEYEIPVRKNTKKKKETN
jgi:hypothetical protein